MSTRSSPAGIRGVDSANPIRERRRLSLEPHSHRSRLHCRMAGRPATGQRVVPARHAGTHELRGEPASYAAIVVALVATSVQSLAIDGLAVTMLAARIGQTVTHIVMPPTNAAATLRFALFFLQASCIIAMGAIIAVTSAR